MKFLAHLLQLHTIVKMVQNNDVKKCYLISVDNTFLNIPLRLLNSKGRFLIL